MVGGAVTQLLIWAWVNWALRLAKLPGSESGRSVPRCVHWSECTLVLVLQIKKATGEDYNWAMQL